MGAEHQNREFRLGACTTWFNRAMGTGEQGQNGVVDDPFIERVAGSLLDSIEVLTDEMVRRVVSQDPFFAQASLRSQDAVRADVKVNLGQILRGLAGLEPLDFELARSLARHRAEQGVPVAALLHAYRVAAQVLWDHHIEAGHLLGMSEEFELDQILDGAAKLWALTNTYCSVISQTYDDLGTERGRQFERERMLLLDALIEGRVEDLPSRPDLFRMLDLPDQRPFIVVVAEVRVAAEAVLANVDSALRLTGSPSTWRVSRHRKVGLVALDGASNGTDSIRRVLTDQATGRVGLSPPFTKLVDVARHVVLADLAMRSAPDGSKTVTLFEENPVGALVARSPELGERVALLVLGPVLELPGEDRDLLLSTLKAWLECHGSVTKVSERLFCHRNTVRNRLQRIESLTGRQLADPVGSAELYVASVAARQVIDLDR